MSLVGPRPQVPWAVKLYTPDQMQVLRFRPGITDFASIIFRNEGEILSGSLDPDAEYLAKIHPEKMRLALDYVNNQSFSLDLKIILKTLAAVFQLLEVTMKKFRTPTEDEVSKNISRIFNECNDPLEVKLENFPEICAAATPKTLSVDV